MRRMLLALLILSLSLFSCSTPALQTSLQSVFVYSTFAAEPWLTALYVCADSVATLVRVDDPHAADIVLQVGEPEFLSGFAYQVGEEEILVAVNRQSTLQSLTLDDVQALFMGLGGPSVQAWVYSSDSDVQKVFDRFAMKGRSVVLSALVAVNPQQMLDALANDANAVGILPRQRIAGNLRGIFSVATVPVLALVRSEPQSVINHLVGCLQSK